jgi:hypothetical protein
LLSSNIYEQKWFESRPLYRVSPRNELKTVLSVAIALHISCHVFDFLLFPGASLSLYVFLCRIHVISRFELEFFAVSV